MSIMKGEEIMTENRIEEFFEEEQDIGEEAIVEYDITTSPRDLTPANIVDMIDSGIIEIPLFQRNYVWDIKKASRLVESLILGLPVPELFFYTEGDDNNTYKIIDGQQRFLSIYFFVKGRFPKNSASRFMIRKGINEGAALEELLPDNKIFQDFTLKLSDDSTNQSRYHGHKFLTLDKDTQIKFRLRRFLRTVVVRQNKPDDNSSSMFEIFNRLNTGGTPLNAQEIRASLYYCDFYKMIVRLNHQENWRELMGKPTQDLHSNDIELILRSIALLHESETYTPKMVTFLNEFSQKTKKFDAEYIEYLENLFNSFVEACSMLGERAFFRNNRFSKTLFESVFVAACTNAFSTKTLITDKIDKTSFEKLKDDELFISFLLSGSSSSDNIKGRIKRAKEIIRLSEESCNE